MDFDVIIVGSGPAGVFSAKGLVGKKVLVLDVGHLPASTLPEVKNLFELRKSTSDLSELLIGRDFESLNNVYRPYINPKIKAPLNRFIVKDTERLTPARGLHFDPFFSLAAGGMANAWGAGLFRFLDRELREFPLRYTDLKPFYDEITQEVGINGEKDELLGSLGETEGLQRPPPLPRIAKVIQDRYRRRSADFDRAGIKIGRLRLALLTQQLKNRIPEDSGSLEFFRPHIRSIYNPYFTLEELIKAGAVRYQPKTLVETYRETEDGVEVLATQLETGAGVTYRARKLILAAGTLNTSRIVLRSHQDTTTELKLIENPISYIPFIDFTQIGRPAETRASPSFFGVLYDQPRFEDVVWCSMYGLWGPLRSEYLWDFPLSARGAMAASKLLNSGMIIVQCFYPGVHPPYRVRLERDGQLLITAPDTPYARLDFERDLIRHFRKLRFFSHPRLVKHPAPGNSFHYACTLPMRRDPGKYETDPDGRLSGHRHVYVTDASNFTTLPAINHSMTIMANALRISMKLKGMLP